MVSRSSRLVNARKEPKETQEMVSDPKIFQTCIGQIQTATPAPSIGAARTSVLKIVTFCSNFLSSSRTSEEASSPSGALFRSRLITIRKNRAERVIYSVADENPGCTSNHHAAIRPDKTKSSATPTAYTHFRVADCSSRWYRCDTKPLSNNQAKIVASTIATGAASASHRSMPSCMSG